jgi:hypothetical protein
MSSTRDDFSAQTRKCLAARSGLRCSNPSCRKATAKADPTKEDNWIDLGIAAHITAASPAGPRYDSSLNSEQRKHISNGIWLCYKCAKEIDSSFHSYSVEVLRTWKIQSEIRTARDAAATLDEIAELIAELEHVHSLISEYIDSRESNSPFYNHPNSEEWNLYIRKSVSYGSETQRLWDSSIQPHIANVIFKSESILSDVHDSVLAAKDALSYARTNTLCMKDMMNALDKIRVNLLFR